MWLLKRKWETQGEYILMAIGVPLMLIFMVGSFVMAVACSTPTLVVVGYSLVIVTFLTIGFGGQAIITRRYIQERQKKEDYLKYQKGIDAVRRELGVEELLKGR